MRLICLGDSQTFGLGLHRAQKWTTLLSDNLGWEVINAGVNGDTSSGMLSRLRYEVLDRKPDFVMVMGGGNDFIVGADIGCVKANINAIVQHCLAANVRVILVSELLLYPGLISDDYKRLADFDKINEKMKELAAWFPDLCAVFPGITYIDLQKLYWDETGGSTEYSLDGLHTNKAGAEKIANILTNELKVI